MMVVLVLVLMTGVSSISIGGSGGSTLRPLHLAEKTVVILFYFFFVLVSFSVCECFFFFLFLSIAPVDLFVWPGPGGPFQDVSSFLFLFWSMGLVTFPEIPMVCPRQAIAYNGVILSGLC